MIKRIERDNSEQRVYRNAFDCRSYALREMSPSPPEGREIVQLRPGDGYLDLGAREIGKLVSERKAGAFVRWYSLERREGTRLPISLAEEPALSGYSIAKGTYIIAADVGAPKQLSAGQRWVERVPSRYYEFDAKSGEVIPIDVPNFAEDSVVDRLAPTRSGWIFSGSATPWRERSGIYTYDGTKVVLQDRGLANALAVSPDGCKAAYSINTEHMRMDSPYRVKYLDLCQ